MVNTSSRILDDLARLATDAAGAAQGVRREIETIVKTQIERLLRELDVVPREEFEAVREMALLAREENDRLAARIAALEAAVPKNDAPKSDAPKSDAVKSDAMKSDAPAAETPPGL
jgi:BMFP domain-containing protein YqiC